MPANRSAPKTLLGAWGGVLTGLVGVGEWGRAVGVAPEERFARRHVLA